MDLALTMDKNAPESGCEFFQAALYRFGSRQPWSDFNCRARTALGGIDAGFLEISYGGHFNVFDSRAAASIHLKYLRTNGGAESAFPAFASIRANSHHVTSERRSFCLRWLGLASIYQLRMPSQLRLIT